MTMRGHTPEKDGVIACLLLAEMVASRGKSMGEQLRELFERVGERHVDRLDLELSEERKAELLGGLESSPPERIGEFQVERVVRIDGHKFVLENGGFIAVRASGTEPLVRCYLDAPSARGMEAMQAAARALVAGK